MKTVARILEREKKFRGVKDEDDRLEMMRRHKEQQHHKGGFLAKLGLAKAEQAKMIAIKNATIRAKMGIAAVEEESQVSKTVRFFTGEEDPVERREMNEVLDNAILNNQTRSIVLTGLLHIRFTVGDGEYLAMDEEQTYNDLMHKPVYKVIKKDISGKDRKKVRRARANSSHTFIHTCLPLATTLCSTPNSPPSSPSPPSLHHSVAPSPRRPVAPSPQVYMWVLSGTGKWVWTKITPRRAPMNHTNEDTNKSRLYAARMAGITICGHHDLDWELHGYSAIIGGESAPSIDFVDIVRTEKEVRRDATKRDETRRDTTKRDDATRRSTARHTIPLRNTPNHTTTKTHHQNTPKHRRSRRPASRWRRSSRRSPPSVRDTHEYTHTHTRATALPHELPSLTLANPRCPSLTLALIRHPRYGHAHEHLDPHQKLSRGSYEEPRGPRIPQDEGLVCIIQLQYDRSPRSQWRAAGGQQPAASSRQPAASD